MHFPTVFQTRKKNFPGRVWAQMKEGDQTTTPMASNRSAEVPFSRRVGVPFPYENFQRRVGRLIKLEHAPNTSASSNRSSDVPFSRRAGVPLQKNFFHSRVTSLIKQHGRGNTPTCCVRLRLASFSEQGGDWGLVNILQGGLHALSDLRKMLYTTP